VALDRLAARGLTARTVRVRGAWRRIPIALWGVALGALGLGLWAGLAVDSVLLWTSPWVAGLLVLGANKAARTPLVDRRPRGPRLPDALERQVVTTAAELPPGAARDLLAGIIRLSRFIASDGADSARAALVEELIPVACRGARELARLDEALQLLEAPAFSPGPAAQPSPGPAVQRDRLVQRFLETQSGLQRLIAAGGGTEAAVSEDLRAVAAALQREAEAWGEVGRLGG
jgi:hypothetical protein